MLQIQDIVKLVQPNAGGIERVALILEKDIEAMPMHSPTSLYLTGDMVLKPGGAAYFLYFTRSTLKASDKQITNDAAGDYFDLSLVGSVPKVRPESRLLVKRLMNKRCCLIYRDRNKYWRIMRRMRCEAASDTSTPGGYNGTQFNFTGKDLEPPGFWQFEENGIIPFTYTDCDGHNVEYFLIGDPDSNQVLGDPDGNLLGAY